jgi:2-aminoadipate transaminase
MLDALAAEMPDGTRWTRPEGGYQVWVELPEPLDSRDLFADALRAGVLFAPGSQFRPDGRPSRGLRLSLAQAAPERIREGVARLGRIARERLRAGPEGVRDAWVHV